MFRRRRAVALLSLFVTTIGAGGVGYWYYTSSQHTPLDYTPLTAQSTPTDANEVPGDLPASPLHAIHIAEQHAAVASEHDNAVAQTTKTGDEPVHVIHDAAEDHEVAVLASSTTLPSSNGGHSNPSGFAGHASGSWGGMSYGGALGSGGGSRSKHGQHHDSGQTPPTNTQEQLPQQESASPADQQGDEVVADTNDESGQTPNEGGDDTDTPIADNTPVIVPSFPDNPGNSDSHPHVSVPEPATLGLLTLGLLAAAFVRRKVVRVR